MKGASLWKRILNEGIWADVLKPDAVDRTVCDIIKAPIIAGPPINSSESDLARDTYQTPWSKLRLSFPFPEFWCEWPTTGGALGVLAQAEREADGFRLSSMHVVCPRSGGRPTVTGMVIGSVLPDGSLVMEDPGHISLSVYVAPYLREQQGPVASSRVNTGTFSILCDLLELLSCKNVSLQPHDNDPKQVRRAIKRHGGTPDSYRYHTLIVRPPGARSDAPGEDIGIMPRHVCRGHFAEYGPQFNKGLLFGRYAGRFYIPPHLKGKKENGIVEKDYVVAPTEG